LGRTTPALHTGETGCGSSARLMWDTLRLRVTMESLIARGAACPCSVGAIAGIENGSAKTAESGHTRFTMNTTTGVNSAARQMFPTPQANEDAAGTPKGNMQRMLGNCTEVRGETKREWERGTLSPDWVELLMGWPMGWTALEPMTEWRVPTAQQWQDGSWEDGVARVGVKIPNRVNRLKCIGNGQVPQAATMAWEALQPL
jgi:hypothetical protein